MKPVLIEIVEKGISDNIDWMGYPITEENFITYHHIIKKSDGGEMSIDNGAPLTLDGHGELNIIEQKYPDIYKELPLLFIELNQSGKPPTEEYWHKYRNILSKANTPKAPVKVYRRII